jgi:hypothetical protein
VISNLECSLNINKSSKNTALDIAFADDFFEVFELDRLRQNKVKNPNANLLFLQKLFHSLH